jgi:hypothetical protein
MANFTQPRGRSCQPFILMGQQEKQRQNTGWEQDHSKRHSYRIKRRYMVR